MINIRLATPSDTPAIWSILQPIFWAGDTYAQPTDITRDQALDYWTGGHHSAYVAESGNQILGTYYIGPNQPGNGSHICNCGFAIAKYASGQGLARKLLSHAEMTAVVTGFRAMQFNFVLTTNTRAIAIWERAGFLTIGRIPEAYAHPTKGYVDALIMYKSLADDSPKGTQ